MIPQNPVIECNRDLSPNEEIPAGWTARMASGLPTTRPEHGLEAAPDLLHEVQN
jgi:hypothetical protein